MTIYLGSTTILMESCKLALKKKLHEMNPFSFKSLVGKFLEAMEYEKVVVTQASKDKGVDVTER